MYQEIEGRKYTDRVIVKWQQSASEQKIQKLLDKFGLSKIAETQKSGLGLLEVNPLVLSVENAIEILEKEAIVKYAEPDYVAISTEQKDIKKTTEKYNPNEIIDLSEAWELTTGTNQQIVAILDSGVDYQLSDLATNMWQNKAEIPNNKIDDDKNGYVDDVVGNNFVEVGSNPKDALGNGTNIAGIIGGKSTGVNQKVQMMPLKVVGNDGIGSSFALIEGIEYAAKMGADVITINLELGGYSQGIKEAIANNPDVLFVVGAGNRGISIDGNDSYLSIYDLDNVITVGASNSKNGLTSFSNYGESVDLVAPGVNISTIAPGGKSEVVNSTSAAAAYVAGVAALLLADEPNLTTKQIKDHIVKGSKPSADLTNVIAGEGVLNALDTLDEPGLGSIQGSKWEDVNGNGLWDAGEQKLANWTIFLDQDGDGQLDAEEVSTVTDANGNYSFNNLSGGNYTVTEVIKPGWVQTYPNVVNYQWSDSQSLGGPKYNWIDISEVGTAISLLTNDFKEVTIPFDFPFYGETINSIKISSNGYLTIGSNATEPNNKPIPLADSIDGIIAPFWENLNPAQGGKVYYYYDAEAERFIVQYQNVPRYLKEGSLTFQVILESDGTILFQYDEMAATASSATIGIENIRGSDGVEVLFNDFYIQDKLAVAIEPLVGEAKAQYVTLNNGGTVTGIDFGNVQTPPSGSISGSKWQDLNQNGIWDQGETALAQQKVFLDLNQNGKLDTGEQQKNTDANGNYSFTGLKPGYYSVVAVKPAGWVRTYPTEVVYQWSDSNKKGGPKFNWIDISDVGTTVSLGNDNYKQINLPFDFPFYEQIKNSLKLSSNGFLTFGTEGKEKDNKQLGSKLNPNDVIAPFWDNLNPSAGGTVSYYYDEVAGQFIIQYKEIPADINIGSNTFEVILNKDGDITFQYKELVGGVNSSTIGIENRDGSKAVQIVYNNFYAKDKLAVDIDRLPSTPIAHNVFVGQGEAVENVNFGESNTPLTGTIEGYVWNDVNNNEVKDEGELGLENWQVYLDLNNSGKRELGEPIKATNSLGFYSFENLNPGFYTVGEQKKSAWVQTHPTTYKYQWVDSHNLGGPQFNWFDISNVGTALNLKDNDFATIELSSPFWFYGDNKSIIRISSNGYLTFGGDGIDFTNDGIPNKTDPNDYIAPLWGNLNPEEGGQIYYYYDNALKQLIVQYEDVPHDFNGGVYSFQVILKNDGGILFQYDEINGSAKNATIGVENQTGTEGVEIAYNEFYLQDNLAIEIKPVSTRVVTPQKVYIGSGQVLEDVNFGNSQNPPAGQIQGKVWQDVNDNGIWDQNEPVLQGSTVYIDKNDNGKLDTGERKVTTNKNGVYTLTKVEPGVQKLGIEKLGVFQTFPSIVGYKWSDNLALGGPEFEWVEISNVGTKLSLADNDFAVVNLPFDFLFYDDVKDNVKISSNGYLTFGGSGTSPNGSFVSIPNGNEPNDIIAPFWTDLNPSAGGSVYYHYDQAGDRFIVQYQNVPRFSNSGSYTFQVIIGSDNTITYQYKDLNGVTNIATVGIENISGTEGIQIARQENYLKDGMAIEIVPIPEKAITQDVFVTDGKTVNDVNFGMSNVPITGAIEGYKWQDLNNNGLRENNEPGLADWQIYLDVNGDGKLNEGEPTKTTDVDGFYSFTNLTPGQYKVAEVQKPGWQQSYPAILDYEWGDSNSVGGPKYNWIEISNVGTQITLGDDAYQVVNLPFDFPFFDEINSALKVSSNGYLTFGSDGVNPSNSAIPTQWNTNNMIAPFWDDLDPSVGGKVYYHSLGDRFIIQYDQIPRKGTFGNYTFQVILDANGEILYQYRNMEGLKTSATIGVENAAGTKGLQVALNSEYVEDRLAVAIKPVFASPKSHQVFVGSKETVKEVNFGNTDSQVGSIEGYKWNDQNSNGVWDGSESGLSGWTIYLDLNNNSQLDNGEPSTLTDEKGFYAFTGLKTGRYVVNEIQQPNWQQTYPTKPKYQWLDSNSVNGPQYNWVDISGVGTELAVGSSGVVVNLPFNFHFYGKEQDTLKIFPQGYFTFGFGSPVSGNLKIPSTSNPNGFIAPFWDNLYLKPESKVYSYYDELGERFIVQYQNIYRTGSNGSYTFQAILDANGGILFQYEDINGVINSATVGIEDYFGKVGEQISYNDLYVKEQLAVQFSPVLGESVSQKVFVSNGNTVKDVNFGNFNPEAPVESENVFTGTNENDLMEGTAGDDHILGLGGSDTINGRGGNDTLDGGSEGDILSGHNGNDTLIGVAGNDKLIGGAGNDILTGGAGNDILTGGTGKDVFEFTALTDKGDQIKDFASGVDKITISASGFGIAVNSNPEDYFSYDGKNLFFGSTKLAILTTEPVLAIASDLQII